MSEDTTTPDTEPAEAPEQDAQTDDTDAALGDAGKKAIDAMKRERNAARRERDALAARLAEIEQSSLTDLEKAQKAAQEAQERLAEYEARATRQQIALEKGLPVDLVDRLRGDTKDELAEDADRLLALIGTPRKPAPDPTQGGRGAAPSRSGDVFAEFFEGRLNTPT